MTFDFLGLTHYCGTSRNGKGFRMKRITSRKKFTAKLKAFKEWLKKARTMKTKDLWETAKAKLRGHYNYYGVTDNAQGIARFGHEVKKLLFKWLNRRGKRHCLNWERFNVMLKRFPLPKPRIMVTVVVNKDVAFPMLLWLELSDSSELIYWDLKRPPLVDSNSCKALTIVLGWRLLPLHKLQLAC